MYSMKSAAGTFTVSTVVALDTFETMVFDCAGEEVASQRAIDAKAAEANHFVMRQQYLAKFPTCHGKSRSTHVCRCRL